MCTFLHLHCLLVITLIFAQKHRAKSSLSEICLHSIFVNKVIKLLRMVCNTLSQRAHHVESTWIRRGYYVNASKTKFRQISTSFPITFFDVILMVEKFTWLRRTTFFRCNFDGCKLHMVSTYFFRCNFDGRKTHVVSTYFFRCNFDGRNMHVVFTYFFRRNFDGQRFDIVLGKL